MEGCNLDTIVSGEHGKVVSGEQRESLLMITEIVKKLRDDLDETRQYLYEMGNDLVDTRKDLAQTRTDLVKTQTDLAKTQTYLDNTHEDLVGTHVDLVNTREVLAKMHTDLVDTRKALIDTREALDKTHKDLIDTHKDHDKTREDLAQMHEYLDKRHKDFIKMRSEMEENFAKMYKGNGCDNSDYTRGSGIPRDMMRTFDALVVLVPDLSWHMATFEAHFKANHFKKMTQKYNIPMSKRCVMRLLQTFVGCDVYNRGEQSDGKDNFRQITKRDIKKVLDDNKLDETDYEGVFEPICYERHLIWRTLEAIYRIMQDFSETSV